MTKASPKRHIIRVAKDARYFAASNEPFNDSRLSWEARGVMGYLLSKPDGWEVRNDDLIAQSPAQIKVVERIIRELKKYGYLRRYRSRNEDGRICWITEVYESPSMNPTIPPLPGHGSPGHGSPGHGSPGHGGRGYIVSTEKVSTEKVSTEKVSTEEEVASTEPATAAAPPNELSQILQAAGINGQKRLELLQADHVTAAYARAHIAHAAENRIPTGLLIHKMLEGDPAPTVRAADDIEAHIPDDVRHLIKR